MNRANPGVRVLSALLLPMLFASATVLAQEPVAQGQAPTPRGREYNEPRIEPPQLESLGNDRYRIGSIRLDKKRGSFVAPGRLIHLNDAPLEYVAVSKGGYKAYESIIELDSSASEFNLACILAGFDRDGGASPRYQFDQAVLDGPPVKMELKWMAGGKQKRMPLEDAMALVGQGGVESSVTPDWAYLGSFILPGTTNYAADSVGAVIGFVHDPSSVIEHRTGLGIGAYGSVRVKADKLPPIGTAIELVVTAPQPTRRK
jgi:hypothetical protein